MLGTQQARALFHLAAAPKAQLAAGGLAKLHGSAQAMGQAAPGAAFTAERRVNDKACTRGAGRGHDRGAFRL